MKVSNPYLFVIAGNHKEFLYYFPKPDKKIIYVHSVNQLRGHHGGKVLRVGTWKKRLDIEDLEREVRYVEMP